MIAALILLACTDQPCTLAAWQGPAAMVECHRVLATMPKGLAVCMGVEA